MASLYLLHFTVKVADHAGHYLGYARSIPDRLARHRAGQGSPLIRALLRRGGDFTLVRTWPSGSRMEERRLKSWKRLSRFCPTWRNGAAPHV